MTEQEKGKLNTLLDHIEKEKIMKNWFLDVLIFSQEPKREFYDFVKDNQKIPEFAFSAFKGIYEFDNFRS